MNKENIEITNTNKGRVLALGDIHGGLLGLKQVLSRANVTFNDTLIFLGDYVDGWEDSAALIDYLMGLDKTHFCIFLRGNHDWWFEDFMKFSAPSHDWMTHGGVTTRRSYREYGLTGEGSDQHEYDKHKLFFHRMHTHYIDEQNRLFIHGGFTSYQGVRGETDITRVYWDRSLYETAVVIARQCKSKYELERRKPNLLKLYSEIFVGHTTTMLIGEREPVNAYNLWNLDTGAGTNGKLTIMDVDTKEFWQSDLLRDLYPDDPHLEFCNKFLSD